MKTSHISILTIAIAVCLILTAGCIGTTSAPSQPTVTITQQPITNVLINGTPVHYAEVNGVRLGYREYGSGEPVLLLEGFGATMDTWNVTFVSILASKYHVYIYDHRGMGYSSDNNATPTIPQYADDAAGLMKALSYNSMNVYGVSMGSTTSQQLVIDHPERVRKLVLSSSTYSVRIPECVNLLNVLEAEAVDANQTEGLRNEARANLAWNGSYAGLSGIHKDVMLIVGTSDILTPDPVSVQIAGQINGSWLVRFKGIPHAGEHYAPVEYGQSVLNFLAMNESPAISV
jgi:pimeloyl-ACP methyl ester carboxylesterase